MSERERERAKERKLEKNSDEDEACQDRSCLHLYVGLDTRLTETGINNTRSVITLEKQKRRTIYMYFSINGILRVKLLPLNLPLV